MDWSESFVCKFINLLSYSESMYNATQKIVIEDRRFVRASMLHAAVHCSDVDALLV